MIFIGLMALGVGASVVGYAIGSSVPPEYPYWVSFFGGALMGFGAALVQSTVSDVISEIKQKEAK